MTPISWKRQRYRRYLLAVALALVVAGCVTHNPSTSAIDRNFADHAACMEVGHETGTKGYESCREAYRNARAAESLGGGLIGFGAGF